MNEAVLKDLLESDLMEFAAGLPDTPVPALNYRRRKEMKKIFKEYEKAVRPLKRRRKGIKSVIMTVAIAFIWVFAAMGGSASAIKGFDTMIYEDFMRISVTYCENSPKTIEDIYELTYIPEGYAPKGTLKDRYYIDYTYGNTATGKKIGFKQEVRNNGYHYINKKYPMYELEIDGYFALYFDTSNSERTSGMLFWDNEDYLFRFDGNLTKDELIMLAKSVQKVEN